jgi:hypothetical protein
MYLGGGMEGFFISGELSCRQIMSTGVAVLESHGLYARGPAGHSHSAAKFQIWIFGKKLSE